MRIVKAFLIVIIIDSYFLPCAHAYIGPGAGFAVVSSFFVLLLTAIFAFLAIFTWPFRALMLLIKRHKHCRNRKIKRVVVIGLDGFDPVLVKKFMRTGSLVQFKKLSEQGTFRPLRTTFPSISPVAWSSFATGVNPGKHRIFDFYTRDPKNYLPVLSSVRINKNERYKKIEAFKMWSKSVKTESLRKSTSFWKILGKSGIFSSVIRVPISFPPEKFYGCCLSAMCTPDIRGTQGAFTYFSGKKFNKEQNDALESVVIPLKMEGDRFTTEIPGPKVNNNGLSKTLKLQMKGEINLEAGKVVIIIGNQRFHLAEKVYSPWVRLEFKAGFRKKITGITRFLVTDLSAEPGIYMTPINIDPEKPFLPVSYPLAYSTSLSKINGYFATLGLAEDTWALNEQIIDETAFLKQSYDIFKERKQHLFDALKKNKNGCVITVFDTTDRIQHMFFRYLDRTHPVNKGKNTEKFKHTIEQLYKKMDELLEEVQKVLNKDDLLMIISDHGFKQFKWGINLNSWLWKNGYLAFKENACPGGIWFADVDWNQTKAYAYGLAGIFINLKGREKHGVVKPGKERDALQEEIQLKLQKLVNEENGHSPIRKVYLSQKIFKGPYVNDSPDLLIGYRAGYRASWNSAVGKITEEVIEKNTKHWSGDHSIDPLLVPGVFFSNWAMEEKSPSLMDIAPTILNLFGVEKQKYHDGKILRLTPPRT
jgi:predicted AlkP superfamily phosphohydrolase/phosphomutase